MSTTETLNEAQRVMTVCNACRYCEGFCAVYPAMELRRTFSDRDLTYLANLCHNCRDCYYACQYAPPHPFDLNVPRALAELRLETYRGFTRPRFLAKVFHRNGWWVSAITLFSLALVLLMVFLFQGSETVLAVHQGENAFYRVIPYRWMVIPFSALGLWILASLMMGAVAFWREAGSGLRELADLRANLQAAGDTLRLKYLEGGGHGCNYPDDRFSMIRRRLHHFVFYGFLLCFAATTVAAIYDHFLHRPAPYPFWSWPVVLGTAGGLGLLVGTGGLLVLKRRMDPVPTTPRAIGLDVGFLLLLFLTSLTGLLLLGLRQTPAMGTLLAVHLGVVAGLFISMPYGKFVHAVYRYAALVRNAQEQARDKV
jgi:citrate/tricarballylate utilization protein